MTKVKPYDWTQFRMKIEIKAPPSKVYRAWTDSNLITKWFTVKAHVIPKKGGRLFFQWLGGDKLEDKVIAARKNSLFHFPFGSKGEQVKIKIKKIKGGSLVELHQYNMKTDPRSKVYMHMGCMSGWTFFLTNLKSYLENNIDLRSHNPRKSYKQGFLNS